MIPAIFRAKAAGRIATGADFDSETAEAHKLSGALIGVAGAIGAFGGVLVNPAFRQSFLATKSANAAYIAFIVFCFAVTYTVYIRKSQHSLTDV